MSQPVVEATRDDLELLVKQLAANPPAGQVRMTTDADGGFIAQWEMSDGHPCAFGPTTTKKIP